MNIKIGIVGLPNVGKSTLFKTLTKKPAETANYPFTTIEPNVGIVEVPDPRLAQLAKVSKSLKTIPTIVEFVDIAGLVKGAHQGEGLGNKFLANIREVAAIAEVVRVFPDKDVQHVHDSVDPAHDIDVINTELIMSDLEIVTKRLEAATRAAKSGDKEAILEQALLTKLNKGLARGQAARDITINKDENLLLKTLQLLTAKPIIYIANLSEEQYKDIGLRQQAMTELGVAADLAVPISAKIEAELIELPTAEQKIFLKELGLIESGLTQVIKQAYQILGLITFFTSGEPETRAWTVKKGALAPVAAGVIHTDFQKGFIKAETVNWQELVQAGGWASARERAKVRTEGKDYIVQDGDVMLFKFNVSA